MTVTVLFPRARPVGPGPSITSRDRPRPAQAVEKERTQCNTGMNQTALEPFTQVGNSKTDGRMRKQVSLDITPLIIISPLDRL